MNVGYIRVSSTNAAHHDDEVSTQKHKILAAAGHVDSWFIDPGVSGTSDPMNRAGFVSMLEAVEIAIEADTAVTVYASEQSRFGRGARALDTAIESLLGMDDELVTMVAGAKEFSLPDRQEPSEWLADQIMTIFDEYERRVIVARLAAGKARARSEGRHTGGIVPYGYDVDGGLLVENPAQQARITEIIQLSQQGWSQRQIAQHVNLNRKTIARILTEAPS